MTTPEIEELKSLAECKYGKMLSTTTDFEVFSLHLSKLLNQTVSPSTLKRMWGYVSDSHKPRMFTLDVLSQYLGHRNYTDFIIWLKKSHRYNSSFFNADQLISCTIIPGTVVEIGWSPNRLVRLTYLGDSTYEVIESENSKMCPGDRFVTGCFIKKQPLLLPYLERKDGRTPPFIAGRNGGLTIINVSENKE